MRRIVLLAMATVLACIVTHGCAPPPTSHETAAGAGDGREVPPADGPWRPHVLRRCGDLDTRLRAPADRRVLALADELFGYGEGSDAVVELEIRLSESGRRDGLVLFTLAQLYVLAGQGVPHAAPREGETGRSGDWERDRRMWLDRAIALLDECRERRPDDAAVDHLAADALRARGDMDAAARFQADALGKCTLPATLTVLTDYQELLRTTPRQESSVSPEWPPGVSRGGEVVLDLLVSPEGGVAAVEIVRRPGERLGQAAVEAFRGARFSPARVGKYPIWAWTRVTVVFG